MKKIFMMALGIYAIVCILANIYWVLNPERYGEFFGRMMSGVEKVMMKGEDK